MSACSTTRAGGSRSGRFRRPRTIPRAASPQGVEEGVGRVGAAPGEIGYFGHGTTVGDQRADPASRRPDRPDHHRRLPRPAGDRPPEAPRSLRPAGRQAAESLVTPRPAHRGAGAHAPRRHGRDAAGRGGGAPRRCASCATPGSRRWRSASCTASSAREHEETALRILAEEFPEAFACVSHEVAPEFREYRADVDHGGERLSRPGDAAAISSGWASGWPSSGCTAAPHLTQSNGGVIGFERRRGCRCAPCCPARRTGVVAAQAIGRAWPASPT